MLHNSVNELQCKILVITVTNFLTAVLLLLSQLNKYLIPISLIYILVSNRYYKAWNIFNDKNMQFRQPGVYYHNNSKSTNGVIQMRTFFYPEDVVTF